MRQHFPIRFFRLWTDEVKDLCLILNNYKIMKKKKLTRIFLIRKDLLKMIMIMKIALLLTIVSAMNMFATAYSQATKLNLHLENASLEQIFVAIEDQSEFKFLYHDKLINDDAPRKATYRNKTVEEILDDIFSGTDNTYTVLENNLVVITPKKLDVKQGITVTGKVVDATGEPLPGVNIVVQGTTTGAVTDLEGNYTVTVPDENATLVFSFVGFLMEEVPVNGQTTLDVVLVEDIKALDEVVVIGYGTIKKSDLTGSVSTVAADEIAAYPAISMSQALQGRAAGVQIQANNGEPGSSYKVRIRGATSINSSSDPLYVVDGFPGGTLPPPEDIASIEVLKDASATAIYGSRGANGVIMITTKRGQAGKTKVEFNSSWSTQREINRLDLLNGSQFAEYINDTRLNTAENPDEIEVPYANPSEFGEGTDWQDEIFRKGGIQNYQLAVSGGNENVRYYVSGIIYDQKGIIRNSAYNRYSVTSNIDITATEKLRLGANIFARRIDRNGTKTQEGSGGTTGSGVVSAAFKFEPTLGIYNDDGTYTLASINDPHDNPVALALERTNEDKADRFQGNFYGEYEIFQGLTFRATLGGSIDNRRDGLYIPTTLNAGANVGGEARVEADKDIDLISENYLTYSKNFGIHDLTVLGGYSYQSFEDESWDITTQGFITDAGLFYNLDGSANPQIPSSNLTKSEISSWYGRINYKLLGRYLITLNGRYDGSSRFAKNNKWAFFPSGAIAWNIAEESFMDNITILDQLKLRASYGVTGNQAISPYESLAKFGTVFSVINGTPVNAVRPTDVANDNLTWESTAQTDIGVDIGLFNLRLLLVADYYHMKTEDLLFNINLPRYSGYGSQLKNIGSVENKGVEFTLTTRNLVGNFEWETDINFSTNKNEVLSLPDENADIRYRTNPGHMIGMDATNVLRVGDPVGSFYGYIYDGVIQQGETVPDGSFETEPGGEKFRDIGGTDDDGEIIYSPDGELSSADRTIIGNPWPDFIWGINNTFRYAGFDLNFFFQGSQGNDIYSYSLMELDLMAGQNNATTKALNRWTPTNTDTDVPQARSRSRVSSSRWVMDGSYIRLKNLTLGYTFPSSFLNRMGVGSFRLYLSGQNILTITDYEGYDPEVNYRSTGNQNSNRNLGLDYGSYPNAISYTLGLNLTF